MELQSPAGILEVSGSMGLFLPAIYTEVVQTWEGEITGGNLGTSPVSLLPQATVCSIK